MKCLTLLSLASIAGLAAAKYVVIKEPTLSSEASAVCKSYGYRLAKLRGRSHSDVYKATKALYKAKVGQAWIGEFDGKKHHKVLYLEKPVNFKRSGGNGNITRAKCDGDEVCNEYRPVLCQERSEKKKKRSKKSKKHSRRNQLTRRSQRFYTTYSDEACNPEEEYGCDEEEVEEEPVYHARKPQKYY